MSARIVAVAGIVAVAVVLIAALAYISVQIHPPGMPGFDGQTGRRQSILSEISLAIDESVESGDYRCCIEPACQMCFLGKWLWKDGSCDCDTEVAKGNFDGVCPECKSGMDRGECSPKSNDCEFVP